MSTNIFPSSLSPNPSGQTVCPHRVSHLKAFIGGVAFTAVIALLGLGVARLPLLSAVGSMACSILIAVAYRQVAGYPTQLKSGIDFVARWLLRGAIVLFGLKLNVNVIVHQGLPLLLRDMFVVMGSIAGTVIIGKWFKADSSLTLLLGVGSGVCGAAAIAAVSPIVDAKEEDTAVGVGVIALLGTVFAIGYTLLRPSLWLSSTEYGIWCGVSLHEIAHVALAAAPAGDTALAMALLAKLGRVFLLVPLCIVLILWRRLNADRTSSTTTIPVPWFLVGFIAMSIMGTYVFGAVIPMSMQVSGWINSVTSYILTMAMVGLGLNVNLSQLRNKAIRPLLALLLTSIIVSAVTFVML